jgi:DNA-binding NtrC family response regulator
MNKCLLAFLLLTTLIVPLHAKEPVSIAIGKSDIDALGGWQLNRKWYAIALQNLVESGAERIFVDIAFPTANIAHPESDEFFITVLCKYPNIFLLAQNFEIGNIDSLKIVGRFALPVHRFFVPFSSSIHIHGDVLRVDAKKQNTFIRILLTEDFPAQELAIPFPRQPFIPDFAFTNAIKGDIDCTGKDVFIYLDYPGVTSYIVNHSLKQQVSTSVLQLYAAGRIRNGAFFTIFPLGALASLFVTTLLPLLLIIKFKKSVLFASISLFLIVILGLSLQIVRIYVGTLWYGFAFIPLAVFTLSFIQIQMKKRVQQGVNIGKEQTAIENEQDEIKAAEIKALQEKLSFYEHLTTQLKPPAHKNLPPYLLLHRDSPLIIILQKAEQIALTDIPVMIYGESGTGKEQIAKFLHERSDRHAKPFIAINCASLNENLIESELFGYEAGAFTGATKRKIGRFEMADEGTLFLDEIVETSLAVQVKLLRVLQEGVFERVGGIESIHVSVRVIAATNQNLEEAIQNGTFREDLYYRLNGYALHIPPLRERKMDIEHLFKAFLYEEAPHFHLSDSIIYWLKMQLWHGNVRELKSATKRAVINARLKNRKFLLPVDFEIQNALPAMIGSDEDLSKKILAALRNDGFRHRSISVVARELGIHRATVTEYLRGWITRFLQASDLDMNHVCEDVANNSNIESLEKFKERIQGYIESIREKIVAGIQEQMTEETIKRSFFKNLPAEFYQDLTQLIQKIKSIN